MLLAFPSAEVDNNLFHFAYSALILSARACPEDTERTKRDTSQGQGRRDSYLFLLLTEKDRETAEAYLTLVATSHRG